MDEKQMAMYEGGASHASEVQRNRALGLSWDDAEGVPPKKAMELAERDQQRGDDWGEAYWKGYLSRWD